jgi:hypothetical protein
MVNSGLDPHLVGEWLRNSKTALDLFNTAKGLIPKGQERDAIEVKIAEANDALARSNATLAKALDYHLCQCTFPPQIMLWREARHSWVCQNPDCGRAIDAGPDSFFISGEGFV